MSPMANGMLVVSEPIEDKLSGTPGNKYPMRTPKPIATKIHKVRYRSIKPSFFIIAVLSVVTSILCHLKSSKRFLGILLWRHLSYQTI